MFPSHSFTKDTKLIRTRIYKSVQCSPSFLLLDPYRIFLSNYIIAYWAAAVCDEAESGILSLIALLRRDFHMPLDVFEPLALGCEVCGTPAGEPADAQPVGGTAGGAPVGRA